MNNEHTKAANKTWRWVLTSVLLFWVGYVALTLIVGFATASSISSRTWQLTAWGFISSAGLLVLTRTLMRFEKGPASSFNLGLRPSSWGRFSLGLALGAASFGIHVCIVSACAGPVRFEWAQGVGAMAATVYFFRFLSTSCMEELGFRGYALRGLTAKMGPWPAVAITAVAFGLSHLLFGWEMQTIILGVIPGGLLWGMSAIATRGLAVPIGLHAAWNFTNWSIGGRDETGLLRMIVEEPAMEQTRAVGTASYLAIFGVLTVAFWFVHRRNIWSASPSRSS